MSKKYDYFEAMDRTRIICDMIYKLLYDHKAFKGMENMRETFAYIKTASDALEIVYQWAGKKFNEECEKDPNEN